MKNKILIVDDDRRLNEYLSKKLLKDGFEVSSAFDANSAYKLMIDVLFDLVILDINLNDSVDGLDILKVIRNQDDFLPVLIISSINNINTQITGFDIGCDGYLIKPFYYSELKARIDRFLSKSRLYQPIKTNIKNEISYKEIKLNIESRDLFISNGCIHLQKQLFNILLLFLNNPNQIITFDILINNLSLNENCDDPLNTLYVYIKRLRNIFKEYNLNYIKSVRSVGYIFTN